MRGYSATLRRCGIRSGGFCSSVGKTSLTLKIIEFIKFIMGTSKSSLGQHVHEDSAHKGCLRRGTILKREYGSPNSLRFSDGVDAWGALCEAGLVHLGDSEVDVLLSAGVLQSGYECDGLSVGARAEVPQLDELELTYGALHLDAKECLNLVEVYLLPLETKSLETKETKRLM